jgi:hypothetical protein
MKTLFETWEAIKMLTENPKLKFKDISCYRYISSDGCAVYVSYGKNEDIEPFKLENGTLEDKWQLIKEPVDFMIAVKAFDSGKTIRCETDITVHTYENLTSDGKLIDYSFDAAISSKEILEGKWYIKEDE